MPTQFSSATIRHGIGTALTPLSSPHAAAGVAVAVMASGGGVSAAASCGSGQIDGSSSSATSPIASGDHKAAMILPKTKTDSPKNNDKKELTRNKEGKYFVRYIITPSNRTNRSLLFLRCVCTLLVCNTTV